MGVMRPPQSAFYSFMIRTFSSERSPSAAAIKEKRISSGLKKMMKPFFLKCHPDVQTSDVFRKVNLEALQTLNGFMDTLDATCDGKQVDWPNVLPIEFLIKTEEISARKRKPTEIITRRKVDLVVPPKSLRDSIVSSKGSERRDSIRRLQDQVQEELSKILHVAGLPVPKGFDEQELEQDYWGDILDVESPDPTDYEHKPRFSMDERPKSVHDESRDRFIRSIDPKKLDKLYLEAVKEMEADIATYGIVKDNNRLRQELINNIIAKVRIDKEADISDIHQLVTLRRLSLLLEDNFEQLFMEEFGRMWEELTIILTMPRDFGTSESALHRRRKRGQESGFQFTYGADKRVTIHVPVDFRDEELLQELDQNLWDWFDMVEASVESILKSATY